VTPTFAIVTPCFREDDETLTRMIQSVVAQATPCHHIVVSDGIERQFPSSCYAAYSQRGHTLTVLNLPLRMRNSGAGPRAIGALLAFAQGAELVSFLDADNALLPQHTTAVLKCLRPQSLAVKTLRRVFLKDTGEETPTEAAENSGAHIDTNCLTLTRRSQRLLVVWLYWPVSFGTGEDRILSAILNATDGTIQTTGEPTVLYWSEWPIHYQLAGKAVPTTAKRPTRRARTHFHGPSFFAITGQLPIAEQWLRIPAEPIAAPQRDPLICQLLLSEGRSNASAPPHNPPPLNYVELLITDNSVNAAPKSLNTPVLHLPAGTGCFLALALAGVTAYHENRRWLVAYMASGLDRLQSQDAAVRQRVESATSAYVLLLMRRTAAGSQLLAIAAPSDRGDLWSLLAQRCTLNANAQDLVNALQDLCAQLTLPMRHWEVPNS